VATVQYIWIVETDSPVNDTITTGNQQHPAIAAAANGRFFVAWDEPVLHPVDGRVFLADGSALGSQFFVNTTTGNLQYEPSVTALTNGNFVVTFTDTSVDVHGDIRARIFGPDGKPVANAPDFEVAVGVDVTRDSDSDVAALADGGFVVTWTRNYDGNYDLDVDRRIFNADGSARGGLSAVENSSSLATSDSEVAGLADGGFVVTWSQTKGLQSVFSTSIWFQLYDKDNHEVGGPHQIIPELGAYDVHVAGLKDGGFAVAYADYTWGTTTSEITLRLFNANGAERPSDPNPVNAQTMGDQRSPSLTVLSNGFVVVGWNDNGSEVMQAFDPQGGRIGSNVNLPGGSVGGELAALSGGLLATVTESTTSDGSGHSIRSTRSDLIRVTQGDSTSETLVGDALRDLMSGDKGNDTLSGGDDSDTLSGQDGNDALIGGPGVDQLYGGNGDDRYDVDSTGERVDESDGSGLDTVVSTVSFDLHLSGFVFGNLENLVLNGAGPLYGIGNALANVITGNAFNNALLGNGGNDTLVGGAGNDSLNGGAGFDRLVGGTGNDTYVLGNDANTVVDAGGTADLATTTSTRSMLLGGLATIERLTLLSGNINGTGNTLANIIAGSTGANIIKGGRSNDTLSGGRGNDALFGEIGVDRLTGGAGKDNFVFNVAPTLANRDVITDFSHHDDTIKLSHSFFKDMATGPLKSTFFFAGTHAHDGDDHIIYNKANGALYYDSDGTGAHAQVQFATILDHAIAGLAASDFVLI
jgi:Ca2+-binding RTX toxin-like protein